MAIEEEYKKLRTKWKNDIRLHIDNYPNLKLNRSNNLDKIETSIIASPFNNYQEPISEEDKKEGLRTIGKYQILINVMGTYDKNQHRFKLGYANERDLKYPVKVLFGSEVLNLAQSPNSKYMNWTTDLRNDIRRITQAYHWSDFFVRYSHMYIKELLWSCNEHLGVWKDKKGLVEKLNLEENKTIDISSCNSNPNSDLKQYDIISSKHNPAVSGCYIRG